MTDEKITPLRTVAQADLDERQRQVIQVLEELLAGARKGEIDGVMLVALSANGQTFSWYRTGVDSVVVALGTIEVIRFHLTEILAHG